MRLNKYQGYTDEYKYKEGTLYCLEEILSELKAIKVLLEPKTEKPVVEPLNEEIKEVKKTPKTRKKKEVV